MYYGSGKVKTDEGNPNPLAFLQKVEPTEEYYQFELYHYRKLFFTEQFTSIIPDRTKTQAA
jgi:hypothetical protein